MKRRNVIRSLCLASLLAVHGCDDPGTELSLDTGDTSAPAGEEPELTREEEARLLAALELRYRTTRGDKVEDTLELIDEADSASEASYLARLAYQPNTRSVDPPVPPELSDDPDDANWRFDGYKVSLPEEIAEALALRMADRDSGLELLDDKAFKKYARKEERRHVGRRRAAAEAQGKEFDGRSDLYVTEQDEQIWRRKKPKGWRPKNTEGESSAIVEPPTDGVEDEPTGRADNICCGSDGRYLKSSVNGRDMTAYPWQAQGGLIHASRRPYVNSNPPKASCSGTKISERLVISAGHCFYRDSTWNTRTAWIPGIDGLAAAGGGDPSPNGYKNRRRRIIPSKWHDHEWENYDIALFVLYDNASSCDLEWLGWRRARSMYSYTAYSYGVPAYRHTCDASPREDKKCWDSIYGMGTDVDFAGLYSFHTETDIVGGQSGTGTYQKLSSGRKVVGVIRAHEGDFADHTAINSGISTMINRALDDYPHTCD